MKIRKKRRVLIVSCFSEEIKNCIVNIYFRNNSLQVQDSIPFARDAGANYYCFDRNDNSINKVFLTEVRQNVQKYLRAIKNYKY